MAQTKSSVTDTSATWMKVLAFAEKLEDTEFQLRALWGLYNYHLNEGKPRAALTLLKGFGILAANHRTLPICLLATV